MEHSIGVDLGGTDIKAGWVSSVGDISCRVVVPTDVEIGGPQVIASRIAEAVRQVLVKAETEGIYATSRSDSKEPSPNRTHTSETHDEVQRNWGWTRFTRTYHC